MNKCIDKFRPFRTWSDSIKSNFGHWIWTILGKVHAEMLNYLLQITPTAGANHPTGEQTTIR